MNRSTTVVPFGHHGRVRRRHTDGGTTPTPRGLLAAIALLATLSACDDLRSPTAPNVGAPRIEAPAPEVGLYAGTITVREAIVDNVTSRTDQCILEEIGRTLEGRTATLELALENTYLDWGYRRAWIVSDLLQCDHGCEGSWYVDGASPWIFGELNNDLAFPMTDRCPGGPVEFSWFNFHLPHFSPEGFRSQAQIVYDFRWPRRSDPSEFATASLELWVRLDLARQ